MYFSQPLISKVFYSTGEAMEAYIQGQEYENGIGGVLRDMKKALEFYQKASDLGYKKATIKLAETIPQQQGIIREAEVLLEKADLETFAGVISSDSFYQRVVEKGNGDAMYNLGRCYKKGLGVPKNIQKAIELYERAVELGNAAAMNNLGYCYNNGEGVTKDLEKAIELYERAAELGNARAMNNLGYCYYNGEGVTKDIQKAVELYERAVELGDAQAMFNLGICY